MRCWPSASLAKKRVFHHERTKKRNGHSSRLKIKKARDVSRAPNFSILKQYLHTHKVFSKTVPKRGVFFRMHLNPQKNLPDMRG